MKTYDTIIVGAGPAGCAAAYDLAGAGLDVLLLDKHTFPRFKPCAGALTIKTLNLLRYSIAPVVRQVIRQKVVGLRLKKQTLFQGDSPVCMTTVRRELDSFCLDQTLRRGVRFEVIPGIRTICEEKDRILLTDSYDQTYEGHYLLGADGVHSQVRKLTGEYVPTFTAFAIEGMVPAEKCRLSPDMTFDYGVVERGYGWLIPKKDHVNVGIYSQQHPEKNMLTGASLKAYVKKRLGTDEIEHMAGFPIGTGGENYVPRRSRIFLMGDAAGFAEPLWGEGIHNAIKSGQAAAQGVISGIRFGADARQIYEDAIFDIRQDIYKTRKFARKFYDHLSIGYALIKTRPVQKAIMNGFSDGKTFSEISRGILKLKNMK